LKDVANKKLTLLKEPSKRLARKLAAKLGFPLKYQVMLELLEAFTTDYSCNNVKVWDNQQGIEDENRRSSIV